MTFTVEHSTIKFYTQDNDGEWNNGEWGMVAEVAWAQKWNGKIKLEVRYVSRQCNMSELLTTMDTAIAAIKTLSRTRR